MNSVLLLVLAAALFGLWWLHRRDTRADGPVRLPPEYFRGLNHLLNEEQDKALEVFLRLAQTDSESVETHLALGGLFRRRGEVERAIRIHQNLLARPTLSDDQRRLALLELGRDYMHAGLLDRAEALFGSLVEGSRPHPEALEHLLTIYQREGEWEKAIDVARRMLPVAPEARAVIAHCHCELAEKALAHGAVARAEQSLRRALQVDGRCVRAHLKLCDLALAAGEPVHALRQAVQVLRIDPDFGPEVFGRAVACVRLGARPDEFEAELRRHDPPPPAWLPGLTHYLCLTRGAAAARERLERALGQHVTLEGLQVWLSLQRDLEAGPFVERLEEWLRAVSGRLPAYHCRQCGYRGSRLYWQCPTCRSWGTVRPLADGLAAVE
ncbi:MAG: lipopolysaccharide assembly protein B [Gammaproteobacteria bacterium]|nr:MAG: lipopolysaccharide assembly protein B [Gammaproteobacteria bacterium]